MHDCAGYSKSAIRKGIKDATEFINKKNDDMHSFTVNNQDEKSEHIIEFDDENLEMFITESQPNPDEAILNSIVQDEPTIRLLNPFNAFPDEFMLYCVKMHNSSYKSNYKNRYQQQKL